MKTIIIWVAIVIVAGVTVYNTLSLGKVRNQQEEAVVTQPIPGESEQPQTPPTERLVEVSGVDYSTNMVVSNLLQFTPVTPSYSLLGKDIGQTYYDKVNSALRFNDGNTSLGIEFAFAKFGSNTVTINATANDTVDFPELFGDNAWVNYTVTVDSVNGTTSSLTLLDTYHADSTYVNMNSTVFPLTLTEGVKKLVAGSTLKYNRAIFLIGDADIVSMTIVRDFDLGQ